MIAVFCRFVLPAVFVFVMVLLSPATSAESLKVGAAIVDVTPENFPVVVNGGFTPRSVSKVKTPVKARAIVIQSGAQQIAVMVVDSCMLPQDLLDDVKHRVAQQTNMTADQICISATHTHTAPAAARALGTDLDFDYVPFLREKLIQALLEAAQNLEPAEIGWGSVMAPEYTALRRWVRRPDRIEVDPFGNRTVRANMHAAKNLDNVTGESGPEDPELSMIAFRSLQGHPIAVLANFSMHYFGDADISADYFGLFCDGFQQQVSQQHPEAKFVAVMSHGCSGDIWRRDYRTWGGKDDATIQKFADGLREKAVGLLQKMNYESDIELAMQEVRLPMKYRVPDVQRLQWAEKVLDEMETQNPTQKFEVYAREQTYLHKLQETEIVVQAIRLGDIGIVTTPCETYALTGLKFKKQSPFEHQMVIELANGAQGYIPPPEQHVLGGYNTWAARSAGLEVTAEPRIVATGLTMLEQLSQRPRNGTEEQVGQTTQMLLDRKPVAYYRMADMAGPTAEDVSGHGHHGVYEDGVCFYLEGSNRHAYTTSDINRAAFFCGGRMKTQLAGLPQTFTVRMDVWNGLPVDARPVAGWFFSRDYSSSISAYGIHLGIGGTDGELAGRLILKLGLNPVVAGKTALERWKWDSVRLECGSERIRVFLNDGDTPEIDVARPDNLAFAKEVFVGGRSDNDSNFEGRIDEVVFFAGSNIRTAATDSEAEDKIQDVVQMPTALDAIEAERGGRHWIDQKTDDPKSPDDSLAAMTIEDGFQVALFASEPLVKDPVAITFDQYGHMYVVEYSDYPVGENGHGGLCQVVCLKDTDGDAKADQRIVFAEGLDFAHSLMAYREGILVGAKTQLLHLKDTNGDGICDERSVLFDGFTPAHPQMQIGMPVWGLDNRIYCNYGPGQVTSKWTAGASVKLARKDFWFDPVTHEFGSTQGLGQYGNTVDRWGNRFFCTNRNPIKADFLSREVASRNSNHSLTRAEYDVASSGADSKVFPLRAMKSNYLSHAGTHTSACGTTAWLGPTSSGIAIQKQLANSVFVCEPIGHLVTRTIVNVDQLPLTSRRAEPNADFLASTDAWFRPSSLQTGPDGALYLADMYRLWVEHPKFLPKEIAEQIDWRAGEDKGRIYRITTTDQLQVEPLKDVAETSDVVNLLTSENAWNRFLGQRLIVERQDVAAVEELRKLVRSSNPETRLQALATLAGMPNMRTSELLAALQDEHPRVREFAARIASRKVPTSAVLTMLTRAVNDDDMRVRSMAAVALRPNRQTTVINALAELMATNGHNEFVADAVLTACRGVEDRVLTKALQRMNSGQLRNDCHPALFRLATSIGRSGNIAQVGRLLDALAVKASHLESESVERWQVALLEGLATGLKRSTGGSLPGSLPKLMETPPSELTSHVGKVSAWLERGQEVLSDKTAPVADRIAAVELLAWQSPSIAVAKLPGLLQQQTSVELQKAAVNVLMASGSDAAMSLAMNYWSELRPAVRPAVLEAALRRTSFTSMLLDRMLSRQVSSSFLTIDQRARLMTHRDESIRSKALTIYPAAVSGNRQAVVSRYRSVIDAKGSAKAGAAVFKKSCSACHRVGATGHVVGPDLTDVRNRSRLALLHEILDPNSKVEPKFCACTIITVDGKTLSGILMNETSDTVQLRCSGGKVEQVSRDQIEEFVTSEKSLMPEGLETDVSEQKMADLLAFLTQ